MSRGYLSNYLYYNIYFFNPAALFPDFVKIALSFLR